ncbi:MAG: TolC family protein, partial [Butyricimonas faecalis]
MFTTHEKQKELLAMGELAVRQAVENLILNVSAAYYNVLVQHHKLMANRHSLALSNERYDEAKVRHQIGNRSGLEAQQAKIDLNTDSSTYVRQKEALKSAYITLNK